MEMVQPIPTRALSRARGLSMRAHLTSVEVVTRFSSAALESSPHARERRKSRGNRAYSGMNVACGLHPIPGLCAKKRTMRSTVQFSLSSCVAEK